MHIVRSLVALHSCYSTQEYGWLLSTYIKKTCFKGTCKGTPAVLTPSARTSGMQPPVNHALGQERNLYSTLYQSTLQTAHYYNTVASTEDTQVWATLVHLRALVPHICQRRSGSRCFLVSSIAVKARNGNPLSMQSPALPVGGHSRWMVELRNPPGFAVHSCEYRLEQTTQSLLFLFSYDRCDKINKKRGSANKYCPLQPAPALSSLHDPA